MICLVLSWSAPALIQIFANFSFYFSFICGKKYTCVRVICLVIYLFHILCSFLNCFDLLFSFICGWVTPQQQQQILLLHSVVCCWLQPPQQRLCYVVLWSSSSFYRLALREFRFITLMQAGSVGACDDEVRSAFVFMPILAFKEAAEYLFIYVFLKAWKLCFLFKNYDVKFCCLHWKSGGEEQEKCAIQSIKSNRFLFSPFLVLFSWLK